MSRLTCTSCFLKLVIRGIPKGAAFWISSGSSRLDLHVAGYLLSGPVL